MSKGKKREPLPDAVMVSSKVVWAPPVLVGMPCTTGRYGFEVRGRIVEVLDSKKGEVLVLADEGQAATASQCDESWTLFTPGEPFPVSWRQGLTAVQRADGRWEQPVLEVIREKRKAVPGWQLSDAVRCDPAYRNRTTGGGLQGASGRFVGRGEGGKPIERRRWTTTLQPEALDRLREMAESQGISRNEVVEALLLNSASRPGLVSAADPGPAEAVVSSRVSRALRARVDAAATAAGESASHWLRRLIASHLP